MKRQESSLKYALLVTLFLCPFTVMSQEIVAPDPDPLKVVVYREGMWDFVTMFEERDGSTFYQKPGNSVRVAKALSLDLETTRELNRALSVFADACAGKAVNLSTLFNMTGTPKRLFFSIARRHSNGCFQRLHHQYQEMLKAEEKSITGGDLSNIAGKTKLAKTGEGPAVIGDADVGHAVPLLAPESTTSDELVSPNETPKNDDGTEKKLEVPENIRKMCAKSDHPPTCEKNEISRVRRLQHLRQNPPRFVSDAENQIVFSEATKRNPGNTRRQLAYVLDQHNSIVSMNIHILEVKRTGDHAEHWEEQMSVCRRWHTPDFTAIDRCYTGAPISVQKQQRQRR